MAILRVGLGASLRRLQLVFCAPRLDYGLCKGKPCADRERRDPRPWIPYAMDMSEFAQLSPGTTDTASQCAGGVGMRPNPPNVWTAGRLA